MFHNTGDIMSYLFIFAMVAFFVYHFFDSLEAKGIQIPTFVRVTLGGILLLAFVV